jgi:membrane protease YdiL (CAAX protease family)
MAAAAIRNYLRQWMALFAALNEKRNTLLCVTAVCVIVFMRRYHPMGQIVGTLPDDWQMYLRAYRAMLPQLYDAALFLIVPMLTVPFLRGSNQRLGWQIGNWRTWFVDVAVAYAVIATIIAIAVQTPSFADYYPMYVPARTSGVAFTWYAARHLIYMLTWEFLFRGYMLFATERELGRIGAAVFQCLPFAMLHAGKPEAEAYGSIFAGFYLAFLALRAGSFLPCVILHFGAAFTMDLAANILRWSQTAPTP